MAGWAIAEHMRTDLVTDALTSARDTRGSLGGAIFHSDHGAQYTSKDFAQLCASLGVTQSMGAVGTSADNALAMLEAVIADFDTMIAAIRTPPAYVVWHVPVVSGRKP